ncbi:MAG TPA: iron-sulfur cluster assembly protein [Kineosporiaceae bacterium]|nr:iron-sulfur cluster assembly protein [Kineosporiaceae bacterium]
MTDLLDDVRAALSTVLDPELDEPVTTLGFVRSCTVDDDGVATVTLRLPTFFCAPNFSFLMVADAHEAVSAVPGVTAVRVALLDHHASSEINAGVAAGGGFVSTFEGEAVAELSDLRATFLAKAVVAGQDRVARPLVDQGATPHELARLRLGDVPASADLDRLRSRRRTLGLPADDDAPLLIHPDGSPVSSDQVPLHLRRARLTRVGIETNGEYCRSLLHARYAPTSGAGQSPAVAMAGPAARR